MPTWNSRGLRGSSFEELINHTNNLYQKQNLAIIQKIPTPITPVEISGGRITLAYFEAKSTIDYIGAVQGIPICFDAKETSLPYLPLKNIHAHQIEFMQNFRQQKGASFILVNFKKHDAIFLMPIEDLARYHKKSLSGGRKSIPIDAFDPTYKVPNQNGFPVHYLIAVNEYLKKVL